jgi:ankyrin repeat protein
LIDRGADIYAKDNRGRTPLQWACLKGSIDIALALIDRGAYISDKDNDGNTPLHWACRYGHAETTLELIDRGADIFSKNRFGRTFAYYPDILPRVYERLHVSTVRSYTIHI